MSFAAHEMKMPLAGIKTQAQIVSIAPDEATRKTALAHIQKESDGPTGWCGKVRYLVDQPPEMLRDTRTTGLRKPRCGIGRLGQCQVRAVLDDGPLCQISMASTMASASSSSTPKYLTVLSILVSPNKS